LITHEYVLHINNQPTSYTFSQNENTLNQKSIRSCDTKNTTIIGIACIFKQLGKVCDIHHDKIRSWQDIDHHAFM